MYYSYLLNNLIADSAWEVSFQYCKVKIHKIGDYIFNNKIEKL